MPATIYQSGFATDAIQAGNVMTITSSGSALVERFDGQDAIDKTSVSGAKTFGPYIRTEQVRITALSGNVSYSQAKAGDIQVAQLATDAAGNVLGFSVNGAVVENIPSGSVVNTIADLKALSAGQVSNVHVLGYYSAGDGAGDIFRWDGASSAADNGGTVIIPNSAPANGRWLRVYQSLDVKKFGANGDGVTDDTTKIQAALDYVSGLGGGTVFVPQGTYKTSAPLLIYKNTRLTGVGSGAGVGGVCSKISYTGTGIGIKSWWPQNSSTAVNIEIDHVWVHCTNAGNTDGAFVDSGGTYISIHDCQFTGFKYLTVLDQSELVQYECNILVSSAHTSVGVWITDGPDYRAGNSTVLSYTNRIAIGRCQILDGYHSGVGIVDDGGVAHVFSDNNYQGWVTQIRSANNMAWEVRGGEFEGASSTPIVFGATRYGGAATVATKGPEVHSAFILAPTSYNCVKCFSSGSGLTVVGGTLRSNVSAIGGCSSIAYFTLLNPVIDGGGGAYDANPTEQALVMDAFDGLYITPARWTAPTFQNSWVNFGAPYANAGFCKDALGFVHLRGLIKSGTSGATAFTLPAGFRPPYDMFIASAGNSAPGYTIITASGAVVPNGSTASYPLDGVTFATF